MPSELARRIGSTRWFARVGRRIAPPIDRAVLRLTGGRVHVADALLPTLTLTTTGRRSGQPRRSPLGYVREGDTFHVVGTNWGGDAHPSWTHNLAADPHAIIEVRGRRHRVTAREVTDPDAYTRLWSRFVETWPAYRAYLERTTRRPRMFALAVVGSDGGDRTG
jgi:deazaflavin-dependent oxidoreductase (nitroreductase family)